VRCSCQVAVVWAGQGGSALAAAAVAERDRQRRLTGFLIADSAWLRDGVDADEGRAQIGQLWARGYVSVLCSMAGGWMSFRRWSRGL
jgi:hypothetical protein